MPFPSPTPHHKILLQKYTAIDSAECTLPLCQECEPIHLDEHRTQNQQVILMKFSEAYQQAQQQIQQFLTKQKKSIREYQKQLQNDREAVIKYLDSYYSKITKEIQQNKGKCHQLQQKLTKLRKGSIKTLIFYFSGDIELTHEQIAFEPLMAKINKETKEESSNQLYNTKYEKYQVQTQLNKDYHKIHSISAVKLNQCIPLDHNKAFNTAEEVKVGDRNREKNRKSIFDLNKKTEVVNPQPQSRSPTNKYNYNINLMIENEEDLVRKESKKDSPQQFKDYTIISQAEAKEKTMVEEDTPVSFENRYKFTGSQQYEAYKKEREDKIFKQININQNKMSNINEKQINKVLRPSDLDLNLPKEETTVKPSQSPITSQRMRSYSQTAIVNANTNNPRMDNQIYDLKKQVLSPEQIRKMLEKRIEERNRILSIKKSQNYGGATEMINKGWQTRDSIINQIYSDKN